MSLSINNSTNAKLVADAVFEGIYDDIIQFAEVIVTINTNCQYNIEFIYSTDKKNIDFTEEYEVEDIDTEAHLYCLKPVARYFKVKITALTTSTYLRMQTIYKNAVNSVEIDNLPAIQNVEGSVIVSNLPKDNLGNLSCKIVNDIVVDVSGQTVNIGNLPATQNVSGSVIVTNTPSDYAKDSTVSSVYNALTSQATATNQVTCNTKLDTIITNTNKINNMVFDANNSLLVNIDADQSPSIASSANQVTGNNSLASIVTNTGNLSNIFYSGSYYYKTILNGALPALNGVVYPTQSFAGKTVYRLHAYNSDPNNVMFLWIYDSNVTSPTLPLATSLKFILCVKHDDVLQESNLGIYLGSGLRIFISSSASSPVPFTSATNNFLINVSTITY